MNPLIWIRLLAYEPRRRHVEALRNQELRAQRARASRGRTMAELRAAVARQVEVHVHHHPPTGRVVCENGEAADGFVIRARDVVADEVTLSVQLLSESVACDYRRAGTARRPGHERVELSFTPGEGTLRLAAGTGGPTHMTPDALAAFLLAPLWEHA